MPPLLASRTPPLQMVLGVVVPALFGVVTGILLGFSEPAYLAFSILGILGGFFAGLEHRGAGEGAIRGFNGGLLFGAFILLAHEVSGKEPKAHLPHPEILLAVITTLFGVALGSLGGWVRARRHAKEQPAAGQA